MKPIEAGCLAKIKPGGRNKGRVVRVLLPMHPGATYGPDNTKFDISPEFPDDNYWLITALDGRELDQGFSDTSSLIVRREYWLERIEEGEDDGAD